jgi:hypothetical protein
MRARFLGLGGTPSGSASLPPPDAFSITSAYISAAGEITVTWPVVLGATSYTIKRGTSSGSYPTTLSTSATSPYADSGLTDGTIYYYRVYAVNAFGTTTSSNEVSARAFGKSIEFDGVDEGINFGSNFALERTNSWTFSAWVKFSAFSAFPHLWGKEQASGQYQGYHLGTRVISGNRVLYCQVIGTNGTFFEVQGSTNLVTGVWYHIVWTYDGSSTAAGSKFYVNQVLETPTVPQNNLNASILCGEECGIGYLPGQGLYLAARMDQVAISTTTPLDATQVGQLAASGHPADLSQLSFYSSFTNWYWFGESPDSLTTIGGVTDQIGSIHGTALNMEAGDIVAEIP